jgi:hypothetical protein
VCLDLDDGALDKLDATFAPAEEVDQILRQRRIAELNLHLPQSSISGRPVAALLISL